MGVVRSFKSGISPFARMGNLTGVRSSPPSTHPNVPSSIGTLVPEKSATPPEPTKPSLPSMPARATSARNSRRLKLSDSLRKRLEDFMRDRTMTPAQAELIETMLKSLNQ